MKAIFFSMPLFLLFFLQLISGGRISNFSFRAVAVDTVGLKDEFTKSPVLSAEESMKTMRLEPGFKIEIVADEPLLSSPVAMLFDEKGRIWVVEMENYMPDTLGTGEDLPTGKIVILSDKNGDGRMDDRKVFLDSLVLPRAFSFYENGILVAESPNLWFYEISNDKPINKVLVDASYAEGGNVEHQPNGLLRALDNWIYSAKSGKRYRKLNGNWLIERTHFRGQWGISQDDYGRLFYNNNSENLQGDYFSPGLGATNENQPRLAGFSESIIKNNRVFPIRQTPGVNRAYLEGILDEGLKLVNFTAACGPVIFNSKLFGDAYYGNAFVAEPAGNLIKRNILSNSAYTVTGKLAYSDREFLASTDERFRPVNLSVGPDGALYIVDMYRGIIQHKTYLTPYLKGQIKARELSKPINLGRIYKVVPEGLKSAKLMFSPDYNHLIQQLGSSNGWIRNKAQQLIVDSKNKQLEKALRDLAHKKDNPLATIHALWAMEGLSVLKKEDVLPLLNNSDWTLRMQALTLVPSLLNNENYKDFLSALRTMFIKNEEYAAPYLGFLNSFIAKYDSQAAKQFLMDLARKYPDNSFIVDAVISNLAKKEAEFQKELAADTSTVISKRLKKVIDDLSKKSESMVDVAKEYPKGASLFRSICQTCHGADGNGISGLAPPLNKSEWVTGDKSRLIKVILYGLAGPIKIGDKVYKSPEISGEMPGIASNTSFSDEDIAEVANYIRNSWSNKSDKVTKESVSEIRGKYEGREKAFTEVELNQ
jgi:mono/diheme cytochrome c family protein/glucose/arabinose dehydrogenase